MARKDGIDTFGAVSLVGFAAILAFNQVVIKVTNDGFQPVFSAGLRSAIGAVLVLGWIKARGLTIPVARNTIWPGIALGLLFTVEFIFLFTSLDLTTVSRSAIIFYSMPVWLALASHVLLPNERLSRAKIIGLACAMAGVVVAIGARSEGGQASLAGDLLALGAAMCWAGIALVVRTTPIGEVRPEGQLLWQLVISAPCLLIASLAFGPFIRDLAPIHLWGLAFQAIVVVSAGFMFWFWLLSIYPANSVASFSFLSPVLAVILGWAILGEAITPSVIIALALVALGLWLINRPARRRGLAES